jgi:4-amino-4-deoxy-L-arabinose transferase-like glycosyltransferase
VDEAGYSTFAVVEHLSLEASGLHAWWTSVLNQAPNAPLLTALTSLALSIKPSLLVGFGLLSGFLTILTIFAYGIGERLAGPRLGAFAAVVTATLPGAFLFSREYVFAMPTAAMLSVAVYSLLRSDGLRRRWWAIGCGAALGLMLLSRSMSIAFVPGVLAAGAVCLLARRRDDLVRRLVNLGLLVLTGTALAATWYARNLDLVLEYLTSYGYGAQSKYYGTAGSLLSWGRLRSPAVHLAGEDLLLPLAVLMLAGLLALVAAAAQRVGGAEDRRAALGRLAASDAFSVGIVVVAGYAALTTSQNGGNGFTFPIAALIPSLAVLSIRLFPRAAAPAIAAVAVVSCLNIVSNLNLSSAASASRTVSVPGFGALPYANGVPKAVGTIREQVPGPEAEFVDRDKGWLAADRAMAAWLVALEGPNGELPVTGFASRNRLTNSNTVQLAAVLKYHLSIPFMQLNAEPRDSVPNYVHQLNDPALGLPTVLITMSSNAGDFDPLVTQALAEDAARRVGFRRYRSMRLPDGRILRIWRRPIA